MTRIKRHHVKTRTGCLTCRKRRVKCTEERPACRGCKRNFLYCEYPVFGIMPNVNLPVGLTTAAYQFFLEESVPLLCNYGQQWEISLFPDQKAANRVWLPFNRVWGEACPSAAYNDPRIAELLSIYGWRHRLSLQAQTTQEDAYYGRMIAVTSKVLASSSPEMACMAAMIFFAYERLRTGSTGEAPLDEDHAHIKAMISLVKEQPKNAFIREYLAPALEGILELVRICSLRIEGDGCVVLPEAFKDAAHAVSAIWQILKAHQAGYDFRRHLKRWTSLMLAYYQVQRGTSRANSRRAMILLAESQLLGTAMSIANFIDLNPDHDFSRDICNIVDIPRRGSYRSYSLTYQDTHLIDCG